MRSLYYEVALDYYDVAPDHYEVALDYYEVALDYYEVAPDHYEVTLVYPDHYWGRSGGLLLLLSEITMRSLQIHAELDSDGHRKPPPFKTNWGS